MLKRYRIETFGSRRTKGSGFHLEPVVQCEITTFHDHVANRLLAMNAVEIVPLAYGDFKTGGIDIPDPGDSRGIVRGAQRSCDYDWVRIGVFKFYPLPIVVDG